MSEEKHPTDIANDIAKLGWTKVRYQSTSIVDSDGVWDQYRKPIIRVSVLGDTIIMRSTPDYIRDHMFEIVQLTGFDFRKSVYAMTETWLYVNYTYQCDEFELVVSFNMDSITEASEIAGCDLMIKTSEYKNTSVTCKVKQQ